MEKIAQLELERLKADPSTKLGIDNLPLSSFDEHTHQNLTR
jgi:hypothetical protein